MAKILGVSILSASKYMRDFNVHYRNFYKTNNYRSMLSCMNGMYSVLKQYGDISFSGEMTTLYRNLLDKALGCEVRLMNGFIVESKPYFQYDDPYFDKVKFSKLSDEEKVDYIVWLARKETLERLNKFDKSIKSLDGLHLQDECKNVSYSIKKICDNLKVKAKVIKIPAGFNEKLNIYDGNGYHYFVMLTINGENYIVDCTYRQFFRLDNNNLNRFGIVGMSGCSAGTFMLMDEERKKVALHLLKNGWIKCNDKNFKHYLDGFTMSYRNALYYEWLGQVDYSVGYTASDYIEFLNGDDLMTNYEPEDGLGEQEVPLTNKNLRFR